MPGKNVIYGAIEVLKQKNQSSETMINTAMNGFYKGNADDLYNLIKLPVPQQRLELDENQSLICTEQHATFFAVHESEYRSSDLHYTGILKKPGESYTYKLRVFINDKDEPTGDISFYRHDEANNSSESVQLAPDQIDQVIQYALSQTSTLLKVLRKEHKSMLDAERGKYTQYITQYNAHAFDPAATEEQLRCVRAVLSSLDILSKIDNLNYQREYHRFSSILHFIENPPIIAVTEPTSIILGNSNLLNEVAISTMAIESPEVFKAIHIASPRSLAMSKWNKLKQLAESIRQDQKSENVPVSTISSKVNPAYVDFIVLLDTRYRAFVIDYLVFEDENNLAFMPVPQECCLLFETIREQQDKLVIQCLKNLLLVPSNIDNMDEIFQAFSNRVSKLDPRLFRIVIGKDRADFFSYLLEYFPFQTTLLTTTNQSSMQLGTTDKTLLEEIIEKRAINCLREVIKKDYRMNYLDLASDGLPLASHVLRLNTLDSFRFICLRDIRAFDSVSFYRKLIGILKCQPNRTDDIENAKMALSLCKRSSPMRVLAEKQLDIMSNIPEWMTGAAVQFEALAKKSNQLKFIQLRQLAQETNSKISRMAQDNPGFRHQLSQSMGVFSDQLRQMGDEDPQEFMHFMQGMNSSRVENVLDQQIKYCHELNEFLYYSLPGDPADPDELSLSARANLRAYHLERLKSSHILIQDPLHEVKEKLTLISDSLKAVADAFASMADKMETLKQATEAGGSMNLDDVREICNFYESVKSATNQCRAREGITGETKLIEDSNSAAGPGF